MSRKPKRIQRKRTKGWRMPEGAVYVGRPTKWGNPFTLGDCIGTANTSVVTMLTPRQAVELYRVLVTVDRPLFRKEIREELRGKDLCCWCPPDQPCHADVLLEVANA